MSQSPFMNPSTRILITGRVQHPEVLILPGKVLLDLSRGELVFIASALKLLNAEEAHPELLPHVASALEALQ